MSTHTSELNALTIPISAGSRRAPRFLRHPAVVQGLVRGGDLLAVACGWFAALFLRFGVFPPDVAHVIDPFNPPALYGLSLVLGLFITAYVFAQRGLYDRELLAGSRVPWRRLFGAVALAFLLIVLIAFLSKTADQLSRAWLLMWGASTLVFVFAGHLVFQRLMRSASEAGLLTRNVVIVGAGEQGRQFVDQLLQQGRNQARVLGVFDDRTTRVHHAFGDVRRLGRISEAETFIRSHKVDQVFVTLPLNAEERVGEVVSRLRLLPVDVLLTIGSAGRTAPSLRIEHVADEPLLSVSSRPLSGWDHAIKVIEDYVIGGLLAVAVVPVLAAIAVAVKLDSPGPVLFRQKRYGFNNKLIDVYKFRTMYHEVADIDASRLTTRDDPRVTRVGRFLRRTSLDELPQIFNVLNGTMSLIGPRPHATQAKAGGVLYDDAVQEYAARHRVKPGITGWAQVNGWRGETDTLEKIEQRVNHDLYYIENWSFWLDVRILCRTMLVVLLGRNAY